MNQDTKNKFYLFAEYLDQESDQLGMELLDAYRADEMDCPFQFAGEFIDNYQTQFTNEVYKLTKDNPIPALACLHQRMMLLHAQSCLVKQLTKMLENLHPELED
jgi:hypothetical protein